MFKDGNTLCEPKIAINEIRERRERQLVMLLKAENGLNYAILQNTYGVYTSLI